MAVPQVEITINPAGNSDRIPVPFAFTLSPGDSLPSSQPTMTDKPLAGQPHLTFGTGVLSGTTWTVPVSVVGGQVNAFYNAFCTLTTTLGYNLSSQVNVLIQGAYPPPPSPPPVPSNAQNPNVIYSGPVSGNPANPSFRSLVTTDLPSTVQNVVANQNANLIYAGPSASPAAAPSFRAMNTADLPAGGANVTVAVPGYFVSGLTTANGQTTATTYEPGLFNAFHKRYGIKGNDSADDTAGLNDWAQDTISSGGFSGTSFSQSGAVAFLPQPPVAYLTTGPISFTPQGSAGANTGLYLLGPGTNFNVVNYQGGAGTSAFIFQGMAWSKLYGLSVGIGGNAANQYGFDFQFTHAVNNMPSMSVEKCNVQIAGTLGNHIGFRMGQSPQFDSNMANALFMQCNVAGTGYADGSIGWQFGGDEVLATTLLNCSGSGLWGRVWDGPIASHLTIGINATATTLTLADVNAFPASGTVQIDSEQITYSAKNNTAGTLTVSQRGANGTTAASHSSGVSVNQYVTNQGVYRGTSNWTILGGGSSGCRIGYHKGSSGQADIIGTREEGGSAQIAIGNRFLELGDPGSGNSSAAVTISVRAVTLAAFTQPTDNNGVFFLGSNAILDVLNLYATASSGVFDPHFLTNNNAVPNFGGVSFRNSFIATAGNFWTLQNGWPMNCLNVKKLDASGNVTGTIDQLASLQQSTTGTTTGFTAGAGTAMNSASTSTGGTGTTAFTFGDVVLALKTMGLLKS